MYEFIRKVALSFALILLVQISLIGQSNLLQTKVSLEVTNQSLATILKEITEKTTIPFAFNAASLSKKRKYSIQEKDISLDKLLKKLLAKEELKYELINGQILINQKKYYEIYGIVRDETTNEVLTAATVFIENANIGATTNNYGYYSLKVLEGDYKLICSYLGMNNTEQSIGLAKRRRVNFELEANEIKLDEIIVSQPLKSDKLTNAPLNQQTMMELSQETPSIGGEPDLLHVVRAQAGVQSSPGGIGGLYVRGGNTGHNLVLLDGVPVYNWMHLLGINSIFHPEAVRGVQFHTSGFSAKYGGRLASVIDIQSKDGNPEKWSGMAGVNQRSYHGHVSGPLFNKKGAFWIGGRHSFLVPYEKKILKEAFFANATLGQIEPVYYDFNLKINQAIGLNNRLYLSYYNGRDKIFSNIVSDGEENDIDVESELSYGNSIFSFRWNRIYSKNLFSNLTLNRSRFFNQYNTLQYTVLDSTGVLNGDSTEFIFSNLQSNNATYGMKMDFDLSLKNHHIKFGVEASTYVFIPFFTFYNQDSEFVPQFDSLEIDSFTAQIISTSAAALNTGIYIEDEISISKKWNLRLGLRHSSYWTGSSIYGNWEPRFLLTHQFAENTWAALSATKMVQYIHLVSNTDIGLPQDLWLSSDVDYKPSVAWQFGLDMQKQFNPALRGKGSLFYKKMNNLIILPDTLSAVNFGKEVRDQLLIGEGKSFGFETSAYYQKDKWTAFATYSLSWTNRLFSRENDGKAYPFQFDARHYFQTLLNYKLNKNWSFGFRGHLGSPRPFLISQSGGLGNGLQLVSQNPKNENRATVEHRMDFSANYVIKTKKTQHRFSVEVYNAYDRVNPVFYYTNGQNALSTGMKMPIMLSGYYSFKF
jgi:hypothetical protein